MMPPIYVISLSIGRTPTRRDLAAARYSKLGLPFQFYEGFDGPHMKAATRYTYDVDHPGTNYHIGPATIGLSLSHFGLFKAMEMLEVPEFIILEDDCYFKDDIKEEFEKSYNALPADWEVVYLGYCCHENKPTRPINNRVSTIKYPFCSHAIMYKQSVIPKLMTAATLWAPFDIQWIFKVLPYVNCYCFTPPLAGQFTQEGKEIT